MQTLTHYKKLLILAGLSISLLFTWSICSSIGAIQSESQHTSDRSNVAISEDLPQPKLIKESKSKSSHAKAVKNKTSKLKPAPQARQVTPVTSKNTDSVWNCIRRDLHLNTQANTPAVKAELRSLLADKKKLNQILQSAEPYIYFIHEQTESRHLPAELGLIPVIESEFNPNDHSNKGASGLWQLMPGTAHTLGVKVHSGYDGRRNVVASTKAALQYFKDLGQNFHGNWYLAIAAYNCGQGKVESAVRHSGSQNFWNLSLPSETKHYLPKLLAVAEIIKNPGKYGVKLPNVANHPYFTEVKLKKAVSLKNIAKTTGIDMDDLQDLNPDLKYQIVQSNGYYRLLVPVNKMASVQDNYSVIT